MEARCETVDDLGNGLACQRRAVEPLDDESLPDDLGREVSVVIRCHWSYPGFSVRWTWLVWMIALEHARGAGAPIDMWRPVYAYGRLTRDRLVRSRAKEVPYARITVECSD